jgi:deoxyadenosine/deoxycytidine kinase
MEMKLYDEWFDWIVESHHVGPNAIIYLAAPAVVSFGRMQMRARPAEKDISYSYLASLHDRHEKWLSGNALAYRVDATEDFLADPDVLRGMIDDVVAVLNNL